MVQKYSREAAKAINNINIFQNLTLLSLDFKTAKYNFPNSVIWRGVTAEVFIKNKPDFLSSQRFTFRIQELHLTLSDFFHKKFLCIGNALTIIPADLNSGVETAPESIPREGLEQGQFQIQFVFDFIRFHTVKRQVDQLLKQVSTIFQNGQTVIPIHLSGISTFTMNNNLAKAKISTRRNKEGYYILHINKEFFKTMAWQQTYEITDAEAELMADNPLKMPKLIEIMDYAKRKSEKFRSMKRIPEDAYRHVLWSYLLTKEFGPEFAKRVTDAHEEGDFSNTEAEHQMDYNNNAIGRQYALNNYKKDTILRRLLNDPNVVRKAE